MIRLALAVILVLITAVGAAAPPPNVERVETLAGVTQYRLKSNGMKILLAPQRTSPVVTFMVVYHFGSRNEAPGSTGSAHLLEHMIFNKSTENFGRAKGHRTFGEVLYEAGAGANMTTGPDRMNGYATVPTEKLELAMRIEADRLGRGLILDAERQSEMPVVRNEYEIGENDPFRVLRKAVVGAAIQAHPYHWPVIGYRSDIENVTTEKLREYYRTFFWPDNADAVLVGDFDTDEALTLFDRHFGGFRKSPQPIPQVLTVEPPQEGERRAVVRRPGSVGLLTIGYLRPGAAHPDFMALDVLRSILSDGVNSRLYRAVVENGLATGVSADSFALRDPYLFAVNATVAPGRSHDEVETAIKATLAEVREKGVTEAELAQARQRIEVAVVRRRDGTFNFASRLGEAVASADWKWFLTYVDRMKTVSAADVQRVAAAYLLPERATVGWFVPGPGTQAPAGSASREPPIAAATAPVTPDARSPQPAMARTSFAQRTVRKVLPNGLTVAVLENRAAPTVHVRGLIVAGDTAAPAGKPTLPALTARMLARGTTTRTKEAIGVLLDGAGATRSYSSDLNEVDVEANGMARDLPLLLEILADEIRNPALHAAELTTARRVQQNVYARADDSTFERALQRLRQVVYTTEHPYYAPGRDEKIASLAALTQDDLRAFHRERYNGAGTILVIVGDVDAAKTVALVEQYFGGMPRGTRLALSAIPRTSPSSQPARETVTMRGRANMNIVLGAASGLRRQDPDYEAALVGNAVLGQSTLSSRIGQRVRDTEGLSYGVYSRFRDSAELDGLWLVNVNVAPQNLARALTSTREVIAQYARDGATDAEVEIQKSHFAGTFQVRLDSNAGLASALLVAERFGFGPQHLDEFPARIRSLTTGQVNAAMRKYFHADRLHLIVSGDPDKLPD